MPRRQPGTPPEPARLTVIVASSCPDHWICIDLATAARRIATDDLSGQTGRFLRRRMAATSASRGLLGGFETNS